MPYLFLRNSREIQEKDLIILYFHFQTFMMKNGFC